MINQEGGNTDWFNRRAFHPVTGREEKLSASKLPAEESLTCLIAERERRGGGLSQAISSETACSRTSAQPARPELGFTHPVLSN